MASVLIIDDDPQVRDLLTQVMEEEGHTVATACNGEEGMNRYRTQPADLVILDILMPEKEGLETIREIRREFPKVKNIAISGGSERAKMNVLDVAGRLGAHRTLHKPFPLETFKNTVQSVLN